jgi:hypothetical protein
VPSTFLIVVAALMLAYSGFVLVPLFCVGAAIPRFRPYFVQGLRWGASVGVILSVVAAAAILLDHEKLDADNLVVVLSSFSAGFALVVAIQFLWKILPARRRWFPPNKALERSRDG